jgi:hypothetical protein
MTKRFVTALALSLAVTSSGAQDRSREILNSSYDSAVILIEAAIAPIGTVRVHASDRNRNLVNLVITSSPANVRDWAKEADSVLEGVIAVRPGEKVRTKTAPLPTTDGQILELTRETTQKTARFALFFSDGNTVNTIDQPVSKDQARKFIAAMRRAAAVADTMAAERKAATAEPNASPPLGRGQAYFEFQVEKPATLLPGVSKMPIYPPSLLSSGIRGEVAAQFVVDENGLVDLNTFHALKATNELFVESLRNALPGFKYSPAMIGGHRVKQLVQQLFQFNP